MKKRFYIVFTVYIDFDEIYWMKIEAKGGINKNMRMKSY